MAVILVLACSGVALGDFVPGRLYIADRPVEPCPSQHEHNDRIWEVDPATGQVNLFVEIPDELCGIITGIAFTPQGDALRTANYLYSGILEVDGDGLMSVVYTINDGIVLPGGGNGIAYNSAGDFFVHNALDVVKFTNDAGPAEVVATSVWGPGPLAFAPNGDLYIGAYQGVFRLAPDGEMNLFLPDTNVPALAVSSVGDVYVRRQGGLYRYPQADAESPELIARFFIGSSVGSSMTLSLDESIMYFASGGKLLAIDLQSGAITETQIPGFTAGSGIGLYVPEPNCVALILLGLLVTVRRRSDAD